MRTIRTCLLLTTTLLLAGACGDDAGGPIPDARVTIDATAAADAGADAPMQSACEVLCDCMVAYCEGEMQACLTECDTLSASAIACRQIHCSMAQVQGQEVIHCPHARGDRNDPTTPAACYGPE